MVCTVAPINDITPLKTGRELLDTVGREILENIAGHYLELLGTSATIQEINGDYTVALHAPPWCDLLNKTSRSLCNTTDDAAAISSGNWHCHESCRAEAFKITLETGEPYDLRPCRGGLNIYAVPIIADGKTLGVISFGYGTPPGDEASLKEIARRYQLGIDELKKAAAGYNDRPEFIIDTAKKQLKYRAMLIAEIYKSKKMNLSLRRKEKFLQIIKDTSQSLFTEKSLKGILTKVCQGLIEVGYRMAWIGLAEHDHTVRPVYFFGFTEGYLENIKIRWDDSPEGRGPTGTAIRTGKTSLRPVIAEDPRYEPWKGAALRKGYRSSAAIPLIVKNKVIGALNIYKEKVNDFGKEELQELEVIAGEISK